MTSEYFDGNTLRKVRNRYAKGIISVDETWRDTLCTGLAIKLGKRGATWHILTRDLRKKLADFDDFEATEQRPALEIDVIRNVADRIKALHESGAGSTADDFLELFLIHRDAEVAMKHLTGQGMVWETARDEYLAWCLKNRKKATWAGYRSALGAVNGSIYSGDFAHIAGRQLSAITKADLDIVRNNIVARCAAREAARAEARSKKEDEKKIEGRIGTGLRQANLTVAALKACFAHLASHPERYTLLSNPAKELENTADRDEYEESDDGEAARTLTQLEIGAFLHALDRLDVTGKDGQQIARLALMLQLFTGQRRFTAASAILKSFRENENYGLMWRLKDKMHSFRNLPLPEMARDAVTQAKEKFKAYESRYLFPKSRRRFASDEPEGFINPRTISAVVEEMREPGGVFHGLEFVPSTHDLRRAFVTRMSPEMNRFTVDGKQLTRDDIHVITHANEGREGTASTIYDKSELLDIKFTILKEWESYCLEGYTLYMQSLQPRLEAAE